jgi:glycosyltransferase involved in cell wall biosynthesis
MADIDLIIPALNEAGALPWLLGRLPHGVRAIVVDNASTDDSAAVAARHGALVISEPIRGFGSACWAGLQAATASIVAFCDGDGSLDPQDVLAVCDPLEQGEADLVLGARLLLAGSMTWHQRIANRALAFELRRRTGATLTDLGPMRAAPREALLALGMLDRRSGWPLEMVLRAHRAGWRIVEVPVPYAPRRAGTSKVTGTLAGTVRAIKDMSRLLAQR